jgi:hypothetical protein
MFAVASFERNKVADEQETGDFRRCQFYRCWGICSTLLPGTSIPYLGVQR